ncbi:uncharacterized protein LOC117193702 [Drosophila miranda]|uniref:uncharacterized protein LOC117188290 n=1 Tax=Drosophila miranda TaxID=7229 RepID=UPI00143F12E3|nr:uncharacterized protein LOC117188290 [Drosophila miranda]XP_033254321.1 uncharacterized protein LOC117193702 [Drosophila miranda]
MNMNYSRSLIRVLIGLMLLSLADSLVHYWKLEAGAEEGCKFEDRDLKIDETAKNPDVCGVLACQNNQGDALIQYCQIPAVFAGCDADSVKTDADWPDCCWLCVTEVNCAKHEVTTTEEPL